MIYGTLYFIMDHALHKIPFSLNESGEILSLSLITLMKTNINEDECENEGEGNRKTTILKITPYVANIYSHNTEAALEAGYVVACGDCRGRGESDGKFVPFENDADDVYTICDWIVKQKWSNGKIIMVGVSYSGMNQWLSFKKFHKSIVSIVPTASVGPGIDFPVVSGIMYTYIVQWLTLVSGKDNAESFNNQKYWNGIFFDNDMNMDKLVKMVPDSILPKWLAKRNDVAYWNSFLPSSKDYENASIPTLTITGHYDDDQFGALHYYNECINFSKCDGNYLVIGPWNHYGTGIPTDGVGELKFDKNAIVNMSKLHTEWFNWVMGKEGERNLPSLLKNKVIYYEMGSNVWRDIDKFEHLQQNKKKYYLADGKKLMNGFNKNLLAHVLTKCGNDVIKKELNENVIVDLCTQVKDYLKINKDQLIYVTDPFINDLCFTGVSKLELKTIATNDIAIDVNIYEITRDNKTIFISKNVFKVKKSEAAINTTLTKFQFVCRRMESGSRLLLSLSQLNSVYWEKSEEGDINIFSGCLEINHVYNI